MELYRTHNWPTHIILFSVNGAMRIDPHGQVTPNMFMIELSVKHKGIEQ